MDKWYPSSKTCRHCGYIKHDLRLSDRVWVCPECGCMIDRDVNAAINIKNEGLRLISLSLTNHPNRGARGDSLFYLRGLPLLSRKPRPL